MCASDVYSKPKDSLPDPKGSLSSRLPSQAIALAIKEVEKVTTSKKGKKHAWAIHLDHGSARFQGKKRDNFS